MPFSPSQKINLVKQLAYQLSGESWVEIRLTLKQFEIAIPKAPTGADKYQFFLQELPDAGKKKLVELAEHFGVQIPASTIIKPEPSFWLPNHFRMFISHLSAHQKGAGDPQEALKQYGISCFVAHKDIEPTTEWQSEIEIALTTADALVALLHPKFHESKWTDQEIGFAMGRDLAIFAIRLGEVPYGFIGKFQAFDGKGKKVSEAAEELFAALLKHQKTKKKMAEVLVGLFERSATFAEAKKWIGYLEKLDTWEPSFSIAITKAVDENSQIQGSWGVAERVKQLVKQWKKSGVG